MSTLTPKQAQFVEQYLVDLNATAAAARTGYSKKTANEQGSRLLQHPEIAAAIDAAKARRSLETGVDALWTLRHLVEEVEADLADLFDDNNCLKPVSEWPKIWRKGLVASVDVEALYDSNGTPIGKTQKVRLSDRVRRLELIGRHVKVNAFQENINHTGLDALGDRLERAIKRLAL